MVNLDVSAAAHRYGLYYAPDPSSQSVCTIGGNVAFNSGGAHCFKYGMTLNHVLGLQGRARRRRGGHARRPQPRTRSGPISSAASSDRRACFGIALEITLRLLPRPACYRTVLAAYRLARGGRRRGLARSSRSGLLPGAMEIMDHLAIEAAEAAVHAGYPLDAAALLHRRARRRGRSKSTRSSVELDGADRRVGRLPRCASRRTRTSALAIWKGRKSAFSAVGRLSPDFIVQDGVVPRTRLGEALVGIEALGRKHGLRVANVFHAGDGNLHPLILFDGRVAGAHDRAEALAARDPAPVHRARRLDHRRARRRPREARRSSREMYGDDDIACMKRLRRIDRSARDRQPRQDVRATARRRRCAHGLHPLEKAERVSSRGRIPRRCSRRRRSPKCRRRVRVRRARQSARRTRAAAGRRPHEAGAVSTPATASVARRRPR